MTHRTQGSGDCGQHQHEIAEPWTFRRESQTSNQSQQHEEKRQVRGIVKVRREPLLNESVHGGGSKCFEGVAVNSDTVRIERRYRQADQEG